MLNSKRKSTLLTFAVLMLSSTVAFAQETELSSVNASDLPINVANPEQSDQDASVSEKGADTLISPSQAQGSSSDSNSEAGEIIASGEPKADVEILPNSENQAESTIESHDNANASAPEQANESPRPENADLPQDDSFSFDLKMKNVNENPSDSSVTSNATEQSVNAANAEADIPTSVQYTVNPIENLSNSVLSKLDDDLFSQMSQIEKSMTLLTLELRREKIRNEIEAQKEIRRKSAEEAEKQRAEEKLRELERKKQVEAQVIKEQQILADKEKMIEVLKQRKLINAYMNQMLIMQQDWLKEKEGLYVQLAAVEADKKAVIASFKQKLDKVLEASAKNIQIAEEAKANFERIVKSLKTRNEQLKKRIEADALIIKNVKSNLYLKSKSIEELKDKNAALLAAGKESSMLSAKLEEAVSSSEGEDETPFLLSSEYAILGITGQADKMYVELIDSNGQSSSYRVGSVLSTGHTVSEIGSDFARFTKDGRDDFLYIGRSIDGIIPTLGLIKDAEAN